MTTTRTELAYLVSEALTHPRSEFVATHSQHYAEFGRRIRFIMDAADALDNLYMRHPDPDSLDFAHALTLASVTVSSYIELDVPRPVDLTSEMQACLGLPL
jgi:hypothetical protein